MKPGPTRVIMDLPTYMSAYNAQRTQHARQHGLCLSCNESNDRAPLTKCSGCAAARSAKPHHSSHE